MSEGKISVVIVEDQRAVLWAVTELLSRDDQFHIIACVPDGRSAVDVVLQTNPDVVVMDIGLPLMDGIDATRTIKRSMPDCKVLVFSDRVDESAILGWLEAGADGYCKKSSLKDLPAAVRAVAAGQSWVDRDIASGVLMAVRQATSFYQPTSGLSSIEMEVLALLMHGASNSQIAASLGIDVHAVRMHIRHILGKMINDTRAYGVLNVLRARLTLRNRPDNC
jgi:DNA-binding NarL/FixJ family response regulator